DIHRRFGAELAGEFEPRPLWSADANHPPRPHFLRRGHGENPDWTGTLDEHGVAPLESADAHRTIKSADARCQRLGKRTETKRHVIGKLVDLGAGQQIEIDIDIFREAAPQMRRLVEAEIATVIDRREAFIRTLRIMDAVVAAAARHQRRDHDSRSDPQRLAHEVFFKLATGFDDDAAEFVPERERPGQLFWPMSFKDVEVGAADAAGADLDERRFAWDIGPWNAMDDRLGARTGEGRDADMLHARVFSPVLGGSLAHWARRRNETGSLGYSPSARTRTSAVSSGAGRQMESRHSLLFESASRSLFPAAQNKPHPGRSILKA